jgi:hypothetical protein
MSANTSLYEAKIIYIRFPYGNGGKETGGPGR